MTELIPARFVPAIRNLHRMVRRAYGQGGGVTVAGGVDHSKTPRPRQPLSLHDVAPLIDMGHVDVPEIVHSDAVALARDRADEGFRLPGAAGVRPVLQAFRIRVVPAGISRISGGGRRSGRSRSRNGSRCLPGRGESTMSSFPSRSIERFSTPFIDAERHGSREIAASLRSAQRQLAGRVKYVSAFVTQSPERPPEKPISAGRSGGAGCKAWMQGVRDREGGRSSEARSSAGPGDPGIRRDRRRGRCMINGRLEEPARARGPCPRRGGRLTVPPGTCRHRAALHFPGAPRSAGSSDPVLVDLEVEVLPVDSRFLGRPAGASLHPPATPPRRASGLPGRALRPASGRRRSGSGHRRRGRTGSRERCR